jgi:hypothetical protein
VGASTRKVIGNGVIMGGSGLPASVGVIVEFPDSDPPVPDVLGLEIYPAGVHDGQPYYRTTDNVWFVYWDAVQVVWSFYTLLEDNVYAGPNWFATETPTPFPFNEGWGHDGGATGSFMIVAL